MDVNQRVSDLIVIASRLAEVLTQENEALTRRKADVVGDLIEDKNTLARAYETRLKGLKDNGDKMADIDPDLRERLLALGTKLKALVDRNSVLLKVAMESHRRVVRIIAEAVKESQPGPGTYTASGVIGSGRPRRNQPAASITLDRAL